MDDKDVVNTDMQQQAMSEHSAVHDKEIGYCKTNIVSIYFRTNTNTELKKVSELVAANTGRVEQLSPKSNKLQSGKPVSQVVAVAGVVL